MATVLLPILAGNISENCFPATPQELLVLFANNLQAVLENGLAFYNKGTTKPPPELQGYPWFNENDSRWYSYSGSWLAKNPEAASPNIVRRFVTGPAATIVNEIALYDGGDTGPPGTDTGPMWEIDPAMAGRLAIGAGAIPGRTIAPVSIVSGQTLGAGEITQTGPQVGPHVHPLPAGVLTWGISAGQKANSASDAFNYTTPPTTESNLVSPAVTAPMDLIPPVLAGHWLQRTGRIWYRVP